MLLDHKIKSNLWHSPPSPCAAWPKLLVYVGLDLLRKTVYLTRGT